LLIAQWAAWTSSVPYAGAGGSPTFSTLPALWKGVQATCGRDFLAAVPVMAGAQTGSASLTAPSLLVLATLLFVRQ